MNLPEPQPILQLTVDSLKVQVFEDRAPGGAPAAGLDIARAIAERQQAAGLANVIFAAAPSQDEVLASLVANESINWDRLVGFHMDEYLGLGPDHPASFRRYLQEHLFRIVGMPDERLRLIPGERTDRILATCLEYERILKDEPVDIVCAGIGENGHIAFNDPPVADFLDPVLVKVVRLDHACRVQQVNDASCFRELDDVPTHALTLTIPALMRAAVLAVAVPGPRKANAILATLQGPISEACPATALRNHPGATLYLDRDSARLIV